MRCCKRADRSRGTVPRSRRRRRLISDCQKTPTFARNLRRTATHSARLGHATHRTGTTERRLASNRPAFPTSGHRRPFPSRCAERGGRSPQEMAALRQRGVFDVVRPHACAVAQADRCGAGWRPVLTMQRCAQTHRRRRRTREQESQRPSTAANKVVSLMTPAWASHQHTLHCDCSSERRKVSEATCAAAKGRTGRGALSQDRDDADA